MVSAPPLYIQERVHPKALVDDLVRHSQNGREADGHQADMFADFNGLPSENAKTEFYRHDANWSNRMILGDSLQVMASLAEREGLRGKVQCIYVDPPYGIRFNSNFQWSTTSRDVRDGNAAHITREPEQVKAYRDTWREGIHTYLSATCATASPWRAICLSESGSVFVQIGYENVHRVRAVMDEVFGEENFISLISVQTTTGFQAEYLGNMSDFVVWYARNRGGGKSRNPFYRKEFVLGEGNARWLMFSDFSYRGVTASERVAVCCARRSQTVQARQHHFTRSGSRTTIVRIPRQELRSVGQEFPLESELSRWNATVGASGSHTCRAKLDPIRSLSHRF